MNDPRNLIRSIRSLAPATSALLISLLAAAAPAQTGTGAEAAALRDWSREVWTAAQSGKSAPAIDLLERFPATSDAAGAADLAMAVERYKGNIAKRESDRVQRIEEVKADLEKHSEDNELLRALKSAIEWHTLATDKNEVIHSAKVGLLVDQAVRDAAKAESEGRWLDAHALYNHLNVLFEEQRTYEADLRRLSQRLLMLRLYTPESLYQMRNAQRVAEGEEPLPPYNKVGEDWHEKLAGIEEPMLFRSLGSASVQHVDRVPMSKILVGAYQAVRTMVTTDHLSEAFPAMADPKARETFVRFLDERIAAVQEKPEGLDYQNLREGYAAVRNMNASTVKIAPEALIHEFTNGGFSQLDDFSAVIWPDEMEQFSRTTEGTFKGVGVQITLNDALELKVVTPLEGTPAARAGIRSGDLIRKVNGDSTLGMSLNQAVERITGPAGTTVNLTIERMGVDEPIEYTLTRAEIPIYSVKGWRRVGAKETDWDWFVDRPNQIGYTRITQFNTNTTQEMRAALAAMMNAGGLKGLILDLRGNPGGLLSEAVGVSSLFISSGTIVTQEDNKGTVREKQEATKGPRIPEIPVVVLINGGSASASEIVAGALQDYQKAILVGDRSFGKGSVQNVFVLGPKAAFKLTTQYYRLPGRDGNPGRLIHKRPESTHWGIDPDVEVEVLPKQFGESFQLRQDADIVSFDDQGNLIEDPKRPDPSRLITDGLDPQLETGLLLIQSQVVPAIIGARAEAERRTTP
ncbi:MAG: S41 family peptidase [Phycisphaerae bacterium]|nr:S41 family peptidase [Phycisphaerae bacterium]